MKLPAGGTSPASSPHAGIFRNGETRNRTEDTNDVQGRANRLGKAGKGLQLGRSLVARILPRYPWFPVVAAELRTWRIRHVLFARAKTQKPHPAPRATRTASEPMIDVSAPTGGLGGELRTQGHPSGRDRSPTHDGRDTTSPPGLRRRAHGAVHALARLAHRSARHRLERSSPRRAARSRAGGIRCR